MQAEIREDLGADTYFMLRGRLGQIAIMADQFAVLRTQPEARLMQIDEHPRAFLGN